MIRRLMLPTLLITIFITVDANAGIKSKCKNTIKKLKRKVTGVKSKVNDFKSRITNVERELDKAKRDVNRMDMSARKKVLLKSVLDATKRALILTKYYLKIKNYHLYVAKRVKKAAKPGNPQKWWKRIKKARKVVTRLTKLAKQLPARIRDAAILLKDIRLIIRNASAIAN